MLFCSVTPTISVSTPEGVFLEGVPSTMSLDTYKECVFGKIGHTNHGMVPAPVVASAPVAEEEAEPDLEPVLPPEAGSELELDEAASFPTYPQFVDNFKGE